MLLAEDRYKRTVLYFPKKLQEKLKLIPEYPMTVVEAPSGFGKTTAVKEYLNRYLPKDSVVFWYTSLGESVDKAWDNIFKLFYHFDQKSAGMFQKLGSLNYENLPELAAVVRNIECKCQTYIVIDNYQLMRNDITKEIMKVFSSHCCEGFHMVVITQQIDAGSYNTVNNYCVHTIGSDSFFFNKRDIVAYYKSVGISLTPNQLDNVYRKTEGWVSALYLQMLSYIETGSFENEAGINILIEKAIWQRLSTKEKEFLLSLSVFDSFSVRQAKIVLSSLDLPNRTLRILDHNTFISFDNIKSCFYINNILKNFLKGILEIKDQSFKKAVYYRAGVSFRETGKYFMAMQYFYTAGDFEAILSLDLKSSDLTYDMENEVCDLVMKIIAQCPKDILYRHPKALIVFGLELCALGKEEEFKKHCDILDMILEKKEYDIEDYQKLRGEMTFLTTFLYYNDIKKMRDHFMSAYEMLDGPSTLIDRSDSWTFSTASVMYLLHAKKGALIEEMDLLEECLPYYLKLTNGHGSGADSVFRAEAFLNSGDLASAECLCHKAIYIANNNHQDSIYLTASLILARIAVIKGDVNEYLAAYKNISEHPQKGKELRLKYTAGLAKSFLDISLDITEKLPSWLLDTVSIKTYLYDLAIPYAYIIYGKYLLINKEYNKLLGLSDLFLEIAGQKNLVLAKIYYLIYSAIASDISGQRDKAQRTLKRALDLALSDHIYLPFAENGNHIGELLKDTLDLIDDTEGIDRVLALMEDYQNGALIIKEFNDYRIPVLTSREKEIAQLVKLGLTTKEIAERLYISSETVKTTLKKIFKKLNIKSRVELKNMEI